MICGCGDPDFHIRHLWSDEDAVSQSLKEVRKQKRSEPQ
jgi:hypothetical protein